MRPHLVPFLTKACTLLCLRHLPSPQGIQTSSSRLSQRTRYGCRPALASLAARARQRWRPRAAHARYGSHAPLPSRLRRRGPCRGRRRRRRPRQGRAISASSANRAMGVCASLGAAWENLARSRGRRRRTMTRSMYGAKVRQCRRRTRSLRVLHPENDKEWAMEILERMTRYGFVVGPGWHCGHICRCPLCRIYSAAVDAYQTLP